MADITASNDPRDCARTEHFTLGIEHYLDNPATRIVLGTLMLIAGLVATVASLALAVAGPRVVAVADFLRAAT